MDGPICGVDTWILIQHAAETHQSPEAETSRQQHVADTVCKVDLPRATGRVWSKYSVDTQTVRIIELVTRRGHPSRRLDT